MKNINILYVILMSGSLIALSYSSFAERVYHIEKQKVGGDGSGLYDRITQGTWNVFKNDYTVTISCVDPGNNSCVVQEWPPSILIPDDVEANVLLDFKAFISLHDLNFENGTPINQVIHHVYTSSQGLVDIYFHSIIGVNGSMIYELHVI